MKHLSVYRLVLACAVATPLLTGCFGKTAQEELAAAKDALGKGDRNTAIVQLKSALQKNADMADARFLLARALYETGDIQAASIELEKAAKLGYAQTSVVPLRARLMLLTGEFPKLLSEYGNKQLDGTADQVDLQTTLAMALTGQGQFEPAMKLLNSALQMDPGNRRAQLVRIRTLKATASLEVAMKELDALMAKDSKDADAWQLKGEFLLASGKSGEAIEAYRQSVALRKRNVVAQVALITLLMDRKDLVGATAQMKELRTIAPRNPQTEFLAAALALERNDLKEANERIQRLLKGFGNEPRVLQLAATIDIRRGALIEADARLGKLLAINPDDARSRLLQARLQLRLGNAAKAEALLQPLLDEREPSVDALAAAAEVRVAQGDSKSADAYLSKVVQRKPDDVRARVALAASAARAGAVDKALADLRAIAASSRDVQAELAMADIYIAKRNYVQALQAVDAVGQKLPGKVVVPTLRGRVNAKAGDYDAALQNFEAALKIDPNYYPALIAAASIDAQAGRIQPAIDRLQAFVKFNARHVGAQLALIALRERSGVKPEVLVDALRQLIRDMPGEAQPRVMLVEMLLKNKDNKAALAAAQEASAALPDVAEVWIALARVQGAMGEPDQALTSLNKVISLAPNQPQSYLPLAELYASRKDRAMAERTLNRALTVKPDYLPAKLGLVQVAMAAGAKADALKVAKSIQVQWPQAPEGFALAGDVEANSQSWAAAAQSYRTALNLGAEDAVAGKLSKVLLAGKRDAEAAKFADEWLASHPKDVSFMMHLGTVAMLNNELPAAEERFRAVLKVRGDDVLALNNLAWVMNKQGKPGALELIQKAQSLAPDQAPILDTLAEVYAKTGQAAKAVETQKKAVALAPDMDAYRVSLARYYVAAGQKDAAREELKRLAALGDKLPQHNEVRKLLEGL